MKLSAVSILSLLILAVHGVAAEGPKTFPVSEFTFDRPSAWKWVQTRSSMRKAQLEVAAKEAKGDPVEVVFFYFGPNNGGGTDANVRRWFGQFQEEREKLKPKVDKVRVGKHEVTYVEAEGTYMSGSPFGPKTPKPGYRLLGAIIEAKQGNVFVKATGPTKLTAEASPEFRKMVESGLK